MNYYRQIHRRSDFSSSNERCCARGGKVRLQWDLAIEPGDEPLRQRTPAPKSMTLTIEHHEPKLHIEIKSEAKQGSQYLVFDLTIDGPEVKETISGGIYIAEAYWDDIDGTRLMLNITQQSQNGTVIMSRVMKLGSEGKMITTVLTVQSQGHKDQVAYEFFARNIKTGI